MSGFYVRRLLSRNFVAVWFGLNRVLVCDAFARTPTSISSHLFPVPHGRDVGYGCANYMNH